MSERTPVCSSHSGLYTTLVFCIQPMNKKNLFTRTELEELCFCGQMFPTRHLWMPILDPELHFVCDVTGEVVMNAEMLCECLYADAVNCFSRHL